MEKVFNYKMKRSKISTSVTYFQLKLTRINISKHIKKKNFFNFKIQRYNYLKFLIKKKNNK